jgi:hypothetical protein
MADELATHNLEASDSVSVELVRGTTEQNEATEVGSACRKYSFSKLILNSLFA